mgnify:CR=1 FL=1
MPILDIIKERALDIHIPGRGHFTETYRSKDESRLELLMQKGDFWPFHKTGSAERFVHLQGGELIIHVVTPEGVYQKHRLGSECDGAQSSIDIPAGTWFAEEVQDNYVLVEVIVTPAFDATTVQHINQADLLALLPTKNKEILDCVKRLTE